MEPTFCVGPNGGELRGGCGDGGTTITFGRGAGAGLGVELDLGLGRGVAFLPLPGGFFTA